MTEDQLAHITAALDRFSHRMDGLEQSDRAILEKLGRIEGIVETGFEKRLEVVEERTGHCPMCAEVMGKIETWQKRFDIQTERRASRLWAFVMAAIGAAGVLYNYLGVLLKEHHTHGR